MEIKDYINIVEYQKKFEKIRLKDIKDMTIEDALEVFLSLINVADCFPCGYSHTVRAYEILKNVEFENDLMKGLDNYEEK